MKTIFALALGFVFLSGSMFTQAQEPPRREALKKLNLNEEQKAAMKEIRTKTAKQMIDVRADLQKKRLDLTALLDGESPNRAQVEGLSREIGDLQLKQKMLLFDADQSVQKLLTADQKAIWKEIKGKRMHPMRDRMRDRGRGPGRGMQRGR